MSANVILVDTNREVIKKGTNLRFWPALAVALILLVALWLRVPGMNWGLPEGEHFYASYQPDEYTLFYWIRQMKPGVYDFNPHSYFNGTLILFLLAGFYKILSFLGLLKVASSPLFYYQHAEEWMKFYWYGRILMVGIGMLTVWVIYKAGRIAFGRITGLLAAFLFAVVPMHAVISPHLLIEPAATLWFAALILFCFKILKKSEMKNYIWAGVALGSACAVKINCLPLALLLFAAHGMGRVKKWDFKLVREAVRDKRLWISLGASVTAYLIFNPYLLFNLREALFEFKDYYNRYRFGWSYLGYSPIFSFTGLFGYGAGPWFLGWGFFSVLFSFFSKKREIWLTLLGFLLFFYLNSRSSTMFLKYHVVTLPFLVILMAYSFTAVFKKIPRKAGVLFSFLFVWVNLQTLSLSLAYGRLFERPDARDVSSAWIKEYIPEGSKIAVFRKPFWYSPPV
ncbi:MAG TPA: glycosyltransferase family 39 protein, partial [bacterium]|nr:glycosyltransferase family 39 protein [bacterium]